MKLLVCVRQKFGDKYIEVPFFDNNLGDFRETAQRIAFFHVNKRKVNDYNELVHNTFIVDIDTLHPSAAEVYTKL
jgi:hypothetical protein